MKFVPHLRRRLVLGTVLTVWAASVAFGAIELWKYESTPGAPAHSPLEWPSDSHVSRRPGLPTLVLLIHPQCPCSRATIDELAKLMTDCDGKLDVRVLLLHPAGMPDAWVHSGLWSGAAAIPGVAVSDDADGAEARRFGAATSGQALLYAANGRLLFAGGITESRGHSGDNAGLSAIESLVLGTDTHSTTRPAATPVYGCPLFGPSDCQKEGHAQCQP